MNPLTIHFFLQLVIILIVIRLVGQLAKWVGQPPVVGEMIAGVMLGPSLLGALFPEVQEWLFPPESKALIYTVSQIGLVLYMFVVGAEFDHNLIQSRFRSAVAVSLAGILTPFILGFGLAVAISGNIALFMPEVAWQEAGLFMGAAMCITAFPMLARIIVEKRLTGTSMGTLVLAAGAIDDVAAWCLLAVVLAGVNNDVTMVVTAIGGGIAYTIGVLTFVRPLLHRLATRLDGKEQLPGSWLAGILILVMLGAWITDILHIYAVFGAFIMGLAIPRGMVTRELIRQIQPLTQALLLPLFFIYSGLNTQLNLLVAPELWGVTAVVILFAVLGKAVACGVAAYWTGEPLRDSAAIGALMNARGLMELILLGIGLERGVITPTLFTIMVVMAVVTTLMASPLFEWVMSFRARKSVLSTEFSG